MAVPEWIPSRLNIPVVRDDGDFMSTSNATNSDSSKREASPDTSSARKHTADEAGLPTTNNYSTPSSVSPTKRPKLGGREHQTKNAVSILNELCPGLVYNVTDRGGPSHNPIFTAIVKVNDVEYKAQGRTKKTAKHSVAEAVLKATIPSRNIQADTVSSETGLDSTGVHSVNNFSLQARAALAKSAAGKEKKKKKSEEPKEKEVPDATEKNPIMLLNELVPEVTYELVHESGDPHAKTFKFIAILGESTYQGTGTSKKLARAAAARQALGDKFGMVPKGGNSMQKLPASTELHLRQETADTIATKVTEKFQQLTEGNLTAAKRKVLSGFVLTQGENDEFVEVINVSTGTKCVSGERMSLMGHSVNDCHAEILSRRCLVNYLYIHLEHLIRGETFDGRECVLEPRPEGRGYRLKSKFKISLYINTAPCGDARIFAPHDNDAKKNDNHPNRMSRGLLRTKIESGEGTIPIKIGTEHLQTWDGVLQGQRLRTMSCSDKLAKWNAVGLQGALLSHYIEPIYLYAVVLGSLFNDSHIYRALLGRIEGCHNYQNGLYFLHKPKMSRGSSTETRQPQKAPSIALNWDCFSNTFEILNSLTGRPDNEPQSHSRLCKLKFLKRFASVLRNPNVSPLTNVTFDNIRNCTYKELKDASVIYKEAKIKIYETFTQAGLGNWIIKPMEEDDFTLNMDD